MDLRSKCIQEAIDALNLQPNHVEELLYCLHTLKGNTAYLKIQKLTQMIHDFESFLIHSKCHPEFKKIVHEKWLMLRQEFLQLQTSHAASEGFSGSTVASYFSHYPQLLSDLAQDLGKQVEFQLEGGDLLLPDKKWAEVFTQFIHAARNSIIHGITSSGTIRFRFRRVDDCLVVDLSDDGQGVEWKRLACFEDEIIDQKQALRRILKGGISSTKVPNELSGRGVGLASLMSTVRKWNGWVEIKSSRDQGFSLRISIPLIDCPLIKQAA